METKIESEKNDANNNHEEDQKLNISSFRKIALNRRSGIREFPDAFYCALTKELLKDPVVASDGKSYERSVITNTKDHQGDKLYSNRALKEVIDKVVELRGDSIQSEMLRYRRFFQESMQGILDKTPIPSEHIYPLPDAYHCPITFGLIHVPVIDSEGNTFEKVAINAWITQNNSSPITRTPQSIDNLYPNHAISSLLEYEKSKDDEFMHPLIRKFMDEEPPKSPIPREELQDGVQVIRPTRDMYPSTPAQLHAEQMSRAWNSMVRRWRLSMMMLAIPIVYISRSLIYYCALVVISLPVLRFCHNVRFAERC